MIEISSETAVSPSPALITIDDCPAAGSTEPRKEMLRFPEREEMTAGSRMSDPEAETGMALRSETESPTRRRQSKESPACKDLGKQES